MSPRPAFISRSGALEEKRKSDWKYSGFERHYWAIATNVGDRTSLFIAYVHPEGPAQQAGLNHGDEVVSVNGESLIGKTYEEVKLGVKREEEVREMPITRTPDEKLSKG